MIIAAVSGPLKRKKNNSTHIHLFTCDPKDIVNYKNTIKLRTEAKREKHFQPVSQITDPHKDCDKVMKID